MTHQPTASDLRRQQISDLMREFPAIHGREIAELLGIAHTTVTRYTTEIREDWADRFRAAKAAGLSQQGAA